MLHPHQKLHFKRWSQSDSENQVRGQKQKPQALSISHCRISTSYEWYPFSQKNYFTNMWPADHVFSLNKNKYNSRVSILSDTSYLQKKKENSNREEIIISLGSVIMSTKRMRSIATQKSRKWDTEGHNF